MLSPTVKLFTLACLLLNLSPVLSIETVSISSLFPTREHTCLTRCIYTVGYTDLGNALSCGNPYDNNCFCATAAASASVASSWFTACGSSQCSAGDLTADLSVMHSVYASYCINAGFTQPGATDWYPSGPTVTRAGQTPTSKSVQTTIVLTVVTETAPSTSSSTTVTQPQVVTIHQTSTLWVDSSGVPLPSRKNSGPNKTTLGVGLGLGIPLVISIAAWGFWFCLRRRRRRTTPPAVPAGQVAEPGIEFIRTSPILRKPISTQSPPPQVQTTEVVVGSEERMDTFPVPVSPRPQSSAARGHEVDTEGSLRELSGHSQSPPPAYLQSSASQSQPGHVQGRRWELG